MPNNTTLFNSLSEKEKSDYLFQLIKNNKSLEDDFILFFKDKFEYIRLSSPILINQNDVINKIIEYSEHISSVLESIDLESLEIAPYHYDHYVPEYELIQSAAEEEANEIFEPYIETLKNAFKNLNLIDIAAELSSIYLGINNAEIEDDEYNLGDPANEYFFSATKYAIEESLVELKNRPFSNDDFTAFFDTIFNINSKYFNDSNEFLKYISKLINEIIVSNETAKIAWEYNQKYGNPIQSIPLLINKIMNMLGDKKKWAESLQSCFLSDYDSSRDLLNYYYNENIDAFEKNIDAFYLHFKNNSWEFLIDKVKYSSDLHLAILKDIVKETGNEQRLNELHTLISKDELSKLISTIKDLNIKIKVLAHVKEFDQIILALENDYLNKNNLFWYFDFQEAVSYLFNDRPIEACYLIKKETLKLLKNERSRVVYSKIAELLKHAQHIKGQEKEIAQLVIELYNHKPNLPALKDEFRKANIV
ncbi:MAG: hypothetical protein WCK02_08435 [Bacteroidota bacterium]